MKPKNFKLSVLVLAGLLLAGIFLFRSEDGSVKTSSGQKKYSAQTTTKPAPVSKIPALDLSPIHIAQAAPSTESKYILVPVLMYHHVGVPIDPAGADLTVSPADFEAQVAYFKQKGYETISLAELYAALENQASLPAKPIVFTFDDGYKDVFENAIPILEKYGYKGTFAIATELLGRPTYAVWDDVISAQKSGMEIVSHTENHLDLTSVKYSDEDLLREIVGSKQILESKLGQPVDFFVYPYGKTNAHVKDLLRQAGYKMAFTTAFGLDMSNLNLLTEPRLRVHGQDGLEKLKLMFDPKPRTALVPTNP